MMYTDTYLINVNRSVMVTAENEEDAKRVAICLIASNPTKLIATREHTKTKDVWFAHG